MGLITVFDIVILYGNIIDIISCSLFKAGEEGKDEKKYALDDDLLE